MKISKSSWHYQIVESYSAGKTPPKNLCQYFRLLVISLFIITVILALVLILLSIELYTFYIAYLMPLESVGVVIMFVAMLAWFSCVLICLKTTYFIAREDKKKHKYLESDEDERSLLSKVYISHKEKICPLLEFTK